MTEQERLNIREKLNRALDESYKKMLRQKMKAGESVITSDGNGNPIEISAGEAWERYKAETGMID